ncbi:MFS transporter [Rhizobium sullae]|uniref:MFS transporter n=1 Tax=Rhizobium sullae TaxID=50338 RepID=A0ABY5XF42_RHISU|nr:MFS transporter [Rhizobium sullae]UWU13199.1 MFS transporter [Rhizobium sullae]
MSTAAGVASFSVVDVIYFQNIGYNLVFIGLMVSVFNIFVSLAELPFAILFDKYSSKLSLYIGFSLRIIAFAIFAANFGASSMFVAQALAGIATAAASGTTYALILNEVKERSHESMSSELSRMGLYGGAGSLIGGCAGVLAFYYVESSIWLLAILFFVLAIVVLAMFHDRPAEGADSTLRELFSSWVGIFKYRATYLLIIRNASAVAPILLWQVKFEKIALSYVFLGFFIINAASTLAARAAKSTFLKLSNVKYLSVANIAAIGAFAFTDQIYIVVIAFLAHIALHVILHIQVNGHFHSIIENKVRASSASLISLSDSAVVAVAAPAIGYLADQYGLTAAISSSAIFYLTVLILSLSLSTPVERAQQSAAQ